MKPGASTTLVAMTLVILLAVPALMMRVLAADDVEGDLEYSLDCASNPQTLKLTNRFKRDIVVTGIGDSTEEPFEVNTWIPAGESAEYFAGKGVKAGVRRLSEAPIFSDDAGVEAALVTIRVGDRTEEVVADCSTGAGSFLASGSLPGVPHTGGRGMAGSRSVPGLTQPEHGVPLWREVMRVISTPTEDRERTEK